MSVVLDDGCINVLYGVFCVWYSWFVFYCDMLKCCGGRERGVGVLC